MILEADVSEPGLFTGPPIFVSGCNRGGTTIVSRLLAAHPEVRNVGRGDFNEGLYVWRQRFHDRSRHRWAVWPWRVFVRRTEADATPENLEFLRSSFEGAMEQAGRMLEKTPANAIRIPLINRLYPDCHFVHVLRDGRHTTASLMARRVQLLYAPHQWVGAHRIALADLAALPRDRVTFVRYEELIADPEAVLAALCTRCELAWNGTSRSAVIQAAGSSLEPVADRWSQFPRWKKRYILAVIGELQHELGYPVEE